MFRHRLWKYVLTVCVLLITAAVASASASATTRHDVLPKPTIVLVHGAFADGSSWNAVTAGLQAQGYPVVVVANPLRDLNGDAAYLASVLSAISGPIIVVGHSYGGEVITDGAGGDPNVKALVYIAAFAPDQGESAVSILSQFPGSKLASALIVRPVPGCTEAYIGPTQFRAVFAADLPVALTNIMAADQRPVCVAALETPSGPPAWKTLPSWYLVAGADQAIPPAAEEFMAQRAHAHTEEVPGASHAVLISHPDRVIELIEEAANAVG
jgi:pimeloyl-ACP methyl ester carboxylesterase